MQTVGYVIGSMLGGRLGILMPCTACQLSMLVGGLLMLMLMLVTRRHHGHTTYAALLLYLLLLQLFTAYNGRCSRSHAAAAPTAADAAIPCSCSLFFLPFLLSKGRRQHF